MSSLTRRILYHKSKKPHECPGIRRIYDTGEYKGQALPYQCDRCLYHIATRDDPSFMPWKWALEMVLMDSCNRDIRALLRTEYGYDCLLSLFITLFYDNVTSPILQRFHISLLHSGITMEMLLRDLGRRAALFFQPDYPLVDFVEDASGVHIEWSVWLDEEHAREKKISLSQQRPFRDELLETTWEPSRVRRWCLDVEEYKEIGRDFVGEQVPVDRATSFQSAP